MMNNVSYLILFFILSCSSGGYEMQYYENNSPKIKAQLKNGIRNGLLEVYYPNGNLKSKQIWQNGKANGVALFYYENGEIEAETIWKNGKLNGLFKSYYNTGELLKKCVFSDSLIIDTLNFYYIDGKVREQHLYDKTGQLCWFKKFNIDGGLVERQSFPTFYPEQDTVSFHQEYILKIAFQSEFDKIRLTINNFENTKLTDTIEVYGSESNEFRYKCFPTKIGENAIHGSVLGYDRNKLMMQVEFTHHYFAQHVTR